MNYLLGLESFMTWEAFGALGQWAGALAAAAAVWWGIYQTKSMTIPKVQTTFDIMNTQSGDILRVFAINDGRNIIRFTSAGIRWVGSEDFLISIVYNNPTKEIVEPHDNQMFLIPIRELSTKCLEAGYKGIKELIFEFTDTQHKIYSGRFKFNVDTMEVMKAKKLIFTLM